jgi:hypothetical protein
LLAATPGFDEARTSQDLQVARRMPLQARRANIASASSVTRSGRTAAWCRRTALPNTLRSRTPRPRERTSSGSHSTTADHCSRLPASGPSSRATVARSRSQSPAPPGLRIPDDVAERDCRAYPSEGDAGHASSLLAFLPILFRQPRCPDRPALQKPFSVSKLGETINSILSI